MAASLRHRALGIQSMVMRPAALTLLATT